MVAMFEGLCQSDICFRGAYAKKMQSQNYECEWRCLQKYIYLRNWNKTYLNFIQVIRKLRTSKFADVNIENMHTHMWWYRHINLILIILLLQKIIFSLLILLNLLISYTFPIDLTINGRQFDDKSISNQ